MACAMKASSLQQQCLVASPWQRSALRSAAAATQLPVRPQQQHRRRLAQQPPCAALMEVAQLAGEAGRAYDGSVWVTAASSVALVVFSGAFVALGASLLAKRIVEGGVQLPDANTGGGQPAGRRTVQPLQRSSSNGSGELGGKAPTQSSRDEVQ